MSSQQRPLPPPPPDYRPQYAPAQTPQYGPAPQQQPRRKNRAAQAIAVLLVLLLLFMVLFYSPFGQLLLGPLTGHKIYPASSSFTLTRTMQVGISQGEINYALDLPVPMDYSTTMGNAQNIISVGTSSGARNLIKYGGDWIEWTGTANAPVQMTITTRAEVQTIVWNIDGSNSGHISDIPASMDYQLGNEWMVEGPNGNPTGEYKIWPTNPTISSLARTLTSNSATVYENVKNIYDYVQANVNYQAISGSEPKSCLDTLADRTGDCDDQSILLISLSRAAGIPAWLAFGTLYDSVQDKWGPHAWAEVYVPMTNGGAQRPAIDSANSEFFVRNCNRLEEWKSDGNGQHLGDYYHLLTYNYSIIGNHPVPAVTLDESYSGSYTASGNVSGFIELFLAPARWRDIWKIP